MKTGGHAESGLQFSGCNFQDCDNPSLPSYWPHREREKKGKSRSSDTSVGQGAGASGDSLAAFHERLRDICQNDGACHGQNRKDRIRAQAKYATALAAELGCLIDAGVSWRQFLALCPDATIGTEHMVELDARAGLVGKTTIPPAFGLMPELRRHSLAVLRSAVGAPRERMAIEFVPATPLEYLSR